MKLLANENFSRASVLLLREKGFDVSSISEIEPGISDLEVLEHAISQNRTILTHDSDYGSIIFKLGLKPPAGVIYFRLKEFSPEEPALLLLDIMSNELKFENALTVLDKHSVRQRSYF